MTRAINDGWKFVKEGGIYQFKHGSLLLEVKVLKDNSNETKYNFLVQPIRGTDKDFLKHPMIVEYPKKGNKYTKDAPEFYEFAEYDF